MQKIIYWFLFLVLAVVNTVAQDKQSVIKKMQAEVAFLASDSLEGRQTGTESERLAAEYIKSKLESYGLTPKGEDEYFQYFEANVKKNPHSNEVKEKITGINVVAYKNNNAKETIIIGAHYDHIGYGNFGSLFDGENEIHNGADDNASGVSILMNIAENIQELDYYNYLFIAFSGEEHGLFGSSFYAKNPTINLEHVRFMINFDMVGRLNKDNMLAVNGVGTSDEWEYLLNEANKFQFNLKTTESGIGPSDHTSFYLQDIPAIHFFTGQHSDYHKPSDDVEKINFEGMYKIYEYVMSIIVKSTEINDFSFQKTQSDSQTSPKFSVTLGVMPDYMFDGVGMRIDGVSKNKTASKYGILKGDIVVQMGSVDVKDMTSYMKALSQHQKGDSTNVKLNRGGKIISVDIVFQ
ncbi:MAG: peptidase M28 [Flavobacteriales bacterium]|nr:peptidase M28 [Flavobacteriales bacterium]